MITDSELEEIDARCERATNGPWYWREGVHTEDSKTSDSGGLHTKTPFTQVLPDGRRVEQDSVLFPIGVVTGEPYWVERFTKTRASGKPTIGLILDLKGRDEDMDFIAHSRDDVVQLLAEVRRLRRLLDQRQG